MEGIDKKILKRIKSNKRGVIFFPEDFSDLGSSGAVRLALHRLVQQKEVNRIAQGIYVRPKQSKLVGEVLPTAEEIAAAIARRDRATIIPTGAYALNATGLSTQVPMKLVYYTDGTPRTITVGNRTILLRKTSPKNLAVKGELSRLVIQALKAIGKDKVTSSEEQKLLGILRNEKKKYLEHDIKLAPAWIASIMKKAL
jgi:hypothetical protein